MTARLTQIASGDKFAQELSVAAESLIMMSM